MPEQGTGSPVFSQDALHASGADISTESVVVRKGTNLLTDVTTDSGFRAICSASQLVGGLAVLSAVRARRQTTA